MGQGWGSPIFLVTATLVKVNLAGETGVLDATGVVMSLVDQEAVPEGKTGSTEAWDGPTIVGSYS